MLSTLNAITSTLCRMNLGQKAPTASAALIKTQNFLEKNENTSVNTEVPSRGHRRHFQGFKRNWPEFYYYMKERRHHNPLAWCIPKTRSAKFPGHIDIYGKDGKREALDAAVMRFKRLDFGAYINTVIGRTNKWHRKTNRHKIHSEQHVFTFYDFHRKLDRMFLNEHKEKRYFIDDPYEKYNKMSFLKHEFSLIKNRKLIEEHGPKMYKFDRYRMHKDLNGPYNHQPKEHYMPPGFRKTVADNNGVYLPEGENEVQDPDWMAPHCQRSPIRDPDFVKAQKDFSKTGYRLDRDIDHLRNAEIFYGRLKPWSRLMHKKRY